MSNVIHHDDPPCDMRLDASGKCPKCQLVPDTQSTQLAEPCSAVNGDYQCQRPHLHNGDHVIVTRAGAHVRSPLTRAEQDSRAMPQARLPVAGSFIDDYRIWQRSMVELEPAHRVPYTPEWRREVDAVCATRNPSLGRLPPGEHTVTLPEPPTPGRLWAQAAGNPDEYMRLMIEHGHVVPKTAQSVAPFWLHLDRAIVELIKAREAQDPKLIAKALAGVEEAVASLRKQL